MTPNARRDYVHSLLTVPLKEWDSGSSRLTSLQTVNTYQDEDNQRLYFHQYAAKHIALWAAVRTALKWEQHADSALVSVGSGPMLCLFGWCLNDAWRGPVIELDPLDWNGVRSHAKWQEARDYLCGQRISRYSPTFLPGPTVPFQLVGLTGLTYAKPDFFPRGSTILMPHMVNHLLEGVTFKVDMAKRLADWIRESTHVHGCRIVISDMPENDIAHWNVLIANAGLNGNLPFKTFNFESELFQQDGLYGYDTAVAAFRTGRRYPAFRVARVLAIDKTCWQFLGSRP